MYQENTVDDDLLNEGRRNLRNYMQTKGYFDATVEVARKQDRERDLVNIVYNIDPGERHKLASLEITGNQYFTTETIRERLTIAPSTWVELNGRFSQKMLTDDVASIKNLVLQQRISGSEDRHRSDQRLQRQEGRHRGQDRDRRRSADAGRRLAD